MHCDELGKLALSEAGRSTQFPQLVLGVHQRTLRAAAQAGRLQVTFSVRSVFGRPIRFATRAAGHAFMRTHYRDYGRPRHIVAPLPPVPPDYHVFLKRLRHQLRLTQDDLARQIGAANKAVIYQWESRKRTPSPVFWQRVELLAGTLVRHHPSSRGRIAENGSALRNDCRVNRSRFK